MKIDCSSSAIFTPVKGETTCDSVTPVKTNESDNCDGRPSRLPVPSKQQELILKSLRKSHTFLVHGKVKYSELENVGLSSGSVAEILKFFQEEMSDVNDGVLKQEEEAINVGYYTEKMKRYLAEEFDIPAEYSFLTLCLLLYSSEHSVTLSESFYELNLFKRGFECEKSSVSSKDLNVEENNLNILKSVMNKSAQFDSDEDTYDDNDDPTYNPAPVNSSVSEFSELSKIGNPLNSVN